jgi:hypothetical protein
MWAMFPRLKMSPQFVDSTNGWSDDELLNLEPCILDSESCATCHTPGDASSMLAVPENTYCIVHIAPESMHNIF